MKTLHRNVLAVAALSAAMLLAAAKPAAAAAVGPDPAVVAADHDFTQAAAKGDAMALSKLLDADFQWIDASESRGIIHQSVRRGGVCRDRRLR